MAFLSEKLISASGGVQEETDPDFMSTTSLLHFDGSNNGTNNTFLDSSDSGHSLTRNGNLTQGSFTPFSADEGNWSVFYDGTDDYLSIPTSDDFAFGTGDYTIEAWVWKNTTGQEHIYEGRDGGNTNRILFYVNSANKLANYINASVKGTASSDFPLNQWVHVALVRSGTTGYMFQNGTQVATWGDSTDVAKPNATLYIGSDSSGSNYFWGGFISNLRVLKGTALYTGSSYTVPTTPLTAVTNTKLLIGCSNRFRDKSTSAHTITTGSTPEIQPFSPFAPSAAYDSAVNGGSGYFDGGSDYLRLPTSSDFDFSGSFTIEAWVYLEDTSTSNTVLGTCANITNRNGLYFGSNGTNFILFQYITNTTLLSAPITPHAWNHVAAVRNGSVITLYINGTSVGSVTYSNSFSGDSANGGVGGFYSNPGSAWYKGYMSDLRVVNGTAVYTSNFTPPTAPLTAVTNTKLLCNFTNGQMIDSTAKNNFETVGSCSLKTAIKNFGTASCDLYGGTGSRVESPPSPLYNILNAGKFTVEFWLYVDNYHAYYSDIVGVFNGISAGWLIYQSGTNIEAYINGVQLQVSRPSTSTWTHIALTRDGTTARLFKDGTSGATSTSSLGADQTSYGLVFGGDATGRNGLDGFIDEFRLTLGKARYTSNFTVPTEAFLNR